MPDLGENISHYKIIAALGAGGMGEVFLAEDTRLKRRVAIKFLPPELAGNEDRMRRFVQEAQAAAALNHPNIAHIYEIGATDTSNYIAMEFVDGVTLREKIHHGNTDLRKLLLYLVQVAEGLAKAHSAGIVHRDLKPDNVMISTEGYAKILDFGLAKLVEPQNHASFGDQTQSDVATAMLQQHSLPGTVMGTIGYMSPEQAQGRVGEIDHRSDIFAFGCILFEAATKHRAFHGKDTLDSLHNIVHAPTPQIKDSNPKAPDDLQRIVRRCLAKDPDRRYQSIKEVAIELGDVRDQMRDAAGVHDSVHETLSEPPPTTAGGPSQSNITANHSAADVTAFTASSSSSAHIIFNELKRSKLGVSLVVLALLLVAGGGIYVWQKTRGQKVDPDRKMQITRLVTGLAGQPGSVGISPDGKYVTYALYEAGKAGLWVKQVSQETSLQIIPPVEEAWFGGTTFSRDGELIYFVMGNNKTNTLGSLYQIPVLGGREPKKIIDDVHTAISFSPDGKQFAFGRINFSTGESALFISNTDGSGEPKKLASRSGDEWMADTVAWSPDGKRIAYNVGSSGAGGYSISVAEMSVEGGAERLIADNKWTRTVSTLLWVEQGNGLIVSGVDKPDGPVQIWHISYPDGGVQRITNDLNDYGSTSLSVTADSNTIATLLSDWSSKIWVAGPNDDESHARKITNGKQDGKYGFSSMPDGRIVYSAKVGENTDLWVMNADGTGAKPLTSDSFVDSRPAVSPDGRYIVFQSSRPDDAAHIWRIDADGGNARQLTSGNDDHNPNISPDGRWVVFHAWRTGKVGLWKVSTDGGEPVQVSDVVAQFPIFSPDGKLLSCLYYDESVSPRRFRPALVSFDDGKLVRVLDMPTTAGNVMWSADAKDFLFINQPNDIGNIWSMPVASGPPKQLTKFTSEFIDHYDVTRDGKRFIVSRSTGGNDIILIKNFR